MLTYDVVKTWWDDLWVYDYWVYHGYLYVWTNPSRIVYFTQNLLQVNFWWLWVILWSSLLVYYSKRPLSKEPLIISVVDSGLLKSTLLITLSLSFFLHIFLMWSYLVSTQVVVGFFFYNYSISFPLVKVLFLNSINTWFNISKFFSITIDLFGLILVFIAYFTGILSLLTLGGRYYWRTVRLLILFAGFIIVVYLYAFITNIILFFLLYECLLVPSFIIARWASPSRRSITAATYFVIWTQIGSFCVLCALIYIVGVSSAYTLCTVKNFHFNEIEVFWLYIVIFLGFGIKVPIWPFHYWLTKTHVEAASGFSMYLSGFLVKTAVFGFYRITSAIITDATNVLFISFLLVGIIDASLKMWGQIDLKKIVAYGTIQEMNIIFLVFCWGDTTAINAGILFMVMHSILSTLMFYIVDCIYVRFYTRSITELNGIIHITPKLGTLIILMCILYSGLPGTLKFSAEFIIFTGFFEFAPASCFCIIFIANVVGIIGFHKVWFNVLFGIRHTLAVRTPLDLNRRDFYISFSCIFLLIILSNSGQFLF